MPVYDDQDTRTRADDEELRRITGISKEDEKKMEEDAVHDGGVGEKTEKEGLSSVDAAKDKKEAADSKDSAGSEKDLFTGTGAKKVSLRTRIATRRNGLLLGLSGGIISIAVAVVISLPSLLITTLRDILVSKMSSLQTSQSTRYRRTKMARISDAFSKEGRMGSKIIAEMEADGYRFVFGDTTDRNRITGIELPNGRGGLIGEAVGTHISDYMEVRHPLRFARWKTKRMEAFYTRYKISRVSVVSAAAAQLDQDPERAVNKAMAREVLNEDGTWDDTLRGQPGADETEAEANARAQREAAANTLDEDIANVGDIADDLKENGTPLRELDADPLLRDSIEEMNSGVGANVLEFAEVTAKGSFGARAWDAAKGFLNPADLGDKVCIIKKRLRTATTVARNYRALVLMKYAMVFISAGDDVRTGNARSSLLSQLMGRTTKLDSNGNPIGASPGFAYALKGVFSKSKNESFKGGYGVDGKTSGVWKGVQDQTNRLPGLSERNCSVIQNPVFQIGLGIGTAIVGFFTGGTATAGIVAAKEGVRIGIQTVVKQAIQKIFTKAFLWQTAKSLALTAAVELSFEGIMVLVQLHVEKSMKLPVTGQEVGGNLGDILTAGAGTANKQRSLQAGMVPATATQYAAAEADYLAWKQQEKSKQSVFARVFDMRNEDSLVFNYGAQLAFSTPTNLEDVDYKAQGLASIIGDVITLRPFVNVFSSVLGGKASAQTSDDISFETYTTEGDNPGVELATDHAGNLLPILRSDIEQIDPVTNIEQLIGLGDINPETLEPISGRFVGHVENCVNAIDVISKIEFENNPNDPAKDCLAQNPVTVQFKAHLAYLDMVDGVEAEFLPEEIGGGAGTLLDGSGSGVSGQTIANFTGPIIPCEGQPRTIQRSGDRAVWDGITPTGVIGKNSANQDINVFVRDACAGQSNIRTVVIGASIHASENGGQVVAQELLFNKQLPPDVRIIAIPEINKAGLTGQSPRPRFNANGVNLNRNFDYRWDLARPSSIDTGNYKGTGPASEPETQAIQSFLTNLGKSSLVISYHDNINWVAPSGPNSSVARPIATRYAALANLPLLNNNQGFGFFEAWYAATTGTPALLVELSTDSSAPYLSRHADAVVGLLNEGLVQ
jgi:hypothetical protein